MVWGFHVVKPLQWFGSGSNPNLELFKRVGTIAKTKRETVDLGLIPYLVYAVLGVCCTQCMLYSVLTHDHCMER